MPARRAGALAPRLPGNPSQARPQECGAGGGRRQECAYPVIETSKCGTQVQPGPTPPWAREGQAALAGRGAPARLRGPWAAGPALPQATILARRGRWPPAHPHAHPTSALPKPRGCYRPPAPPVSDRLTRAHAGRLWALPKRHPHSLALWTAPQSAGPPALTILSWTVHQLFIFHHLQLVLSQTSLWGGREGPWDVAGSWRRLLTGT